MNGGAVETHDEIPNAIKALTELGREFGTMKALPQSDNRASITDTYEHFLASWRHLPLKMLEIGIQKGASIAMWKQYFPNAMIYAVDVKNRRSLADERVEIFVGDQKDPEVLNAIVESAGGALDLVVDDGSHRPVDQKGSLLCLWPHIRPGGLYLIEDIHTSYQAKRDMAWRDPANTIEFLKDVVDDLHANDHGHPEVLPSLGFMYFGYRVCILQRRVHRHEIADALPTS